MMRPGRVLLFGIAILACAQQDDKRYSIRGQVVDQAMGKPLAAVEVTLERWESRGGFEPAISDSDGGFVFSDLPEGYYDLAGKLNGVFLLSGRKGFEQKRVLATVRAGVSRERPVILRVSRPGLLTGAVSDEFGDPLPRVDVDLRREEWSYGRLVLTSVQSGFTDELGRYRIPDLPPGKYVVCANTTGHAPAIVTLDVSRSVERYYIPACYPAQGSFAIAPGETLAINLTAMTGKGVSVLGRVVGAPRSGEVLVGLMRSDVEEILATEWRTEVREDGRFQFDGVLPGRYALEAISDGDEGWVARQVINVSALAVQSFDLMLEQRPKIHVVIHSDSKVADYGGHVQIGLRPAHPESRKEYWTATDGEFRDQLAPGAYWLMARSSSDTDTSKAPCVTSAKIGGREVLEKKILLYGGMQGQLEIWLSQECSAIEARVVSKGEPAASTKVTVLITGTASEPGDLYTGFTSEDGLFELVALAQGRYLLWAWPEGDPGPVNLADVEDQATVVVVRPGETVRTIVTMVEPGKAR